MFTTILIQVQDVGGNWMTIQTTQTRDDRYVRSLLSQAARSYKKRVRAIDHNGMIIDIMDSHV